MAEQAPSTPPAAPVPPKPSATPPAQDQAALDRARAALGQVGAPSLGGPSAISRQSPAANTTVPTPKSAAQPRSPVASGIPRLASLSWKLYAAIAGGFVLAGLLVYFLIFFPATLAVTASPEGAVIGIGDQTATGSLTVRHWPGHVAITVTAVGHVTYQETATLGAGQKQTVTVALRPLATPTPLTDQRVQFPVLDEARSSLLYLDPAAKTAYRLGLTDRTTSTATPITPASLDGITDLIWSPTRQLAFLKQGSTTKLYDFKRYDLVNQTTTDWPAGIGSIDWRPDGEKVAYYFEPGTGERSLIRATKDNGEVERLYSFADSTVTNPELTWSPDAKYLAVRADRLYLFDVFAKTLAEVEGTTGVAAVRWLPTSNRLLAERGDGTLISVSTDAKATDLSQSGRLATIAPLADGTAFVRARAEANGTVTLERVSLADGTSALYATDGLTGLVPTNLLLANDDQTLYFTSAGRLYALALDEGTYPAPEGAGS